jgi:NAD(P)-dependent dehydrogenase (short-subunit alcohol dehydrogenase family)
MSLTPLDQRRIIITGGASGMGAGLVQALPALGAEIVSLDVTADVGARVAAQAGVQFLACDVTDKQSVGTAIAAAVNHLGGLDVLVHAAGIAPGGPAADIEPDDWHAVLAVNATGTLLTNQAAFAYMKSTGGQIINFASAAGILGYPGKAAYAASKGAVIAWTRTIAVEWATHGITVNAVAPTIKTPMYERTRASMTPEQLAAHDADLRTRIPLTGQLGDIDRDLVPVLAFMCSEGAKFITGQVLPVDGGTVMMR